MEKSVKELKSDLVDVSLKISNIIHEEKIDQDAKDELEMIATDLYYFGTKKQKINSAVQKETELKQIEQISEGAADDVDRIVQTYQIEDKEAELLEDVSSDLLSIKDRAKPIGLNGSNSTSLEDFFERK